MATLDLRLYSVATVDTETGDLTLTFIESGNTPNFVPTKEVSVVLPGAVITDLES